MAWTSWTNEEDKLLVRYYSTKGPRGLVDLIPRHSMRAIASRAIVLGETSATWIWKNADNKTLVQLWGQDATRETICAALPNFTWQQIKVRALYLELKRRPPQWKLAPSGNELCDAIRRRAMKLGISRKELDRISRTGKYWQDSMWRTGHSLNRMHASVKALGGTYKVEWGD